MSDRPMDRTTASVMAHVQAERAMQTERYSWRDDAPLSDRDWNTLITTYLHKAGASRYIRLVQVAALAVAAAAERQRSLGSSIAQERTGDQMPASARKRDEA